MLTYTVSSLSGRRYVSQQHGHYEATSSSSKPVVLKNHWKEPTYNETLARDEVSHLERQRMEVQSRHSSMNTKKNSRLYTQPSMVRIEHEV